MKTLIFIFKTTLIIVLTGWILQYNGSVTVQLEEQIYRLSCAESCLTILSFGILFFILGYGYFSLTTGRRYRKKLKKLQRFGQAIDYITKSYAALVIKDGHSAQEWIQKARTILNDSDLVLYLEGQAAYLQEEKTLARTLFKQIAVASYPMFGVIPLIEHHLLSKEESLPLLKKIVKDRPGEKWAWVMLFEAVIDTKNSNKALEIFNMMKKIDVSTAILNDCGSSLFLLQRNQALQKGDAEEAFRFSQKAYISHPKDEKIVIAHIRDLCHQYQKPKALEILSKQWRENTSQDLVTLFKEITADLPQEEKIKWKNHLLNACSDSTVKNYLLNS